MSPDVPTEDSGHSEDAASEPESGVDTFLADARALAEQGDYATARERLAQASQADPTSSQLLEIQRLENTVGVSRPGKLITIVFLLGFVLLTIYVILLRG